MTARAAPSYGATYLMPKVQANWSRGRAVVAWDVSTLSMSARDWIDVWITPFNDLLAVPIDSGGPTAYQGHPRNAIHVRNSNDARSWTVTVIRDFREVRSGTFNLPTRVKPSATDRSAFELRIRRNRVRFGMPIRNRWIRVSAAVPFTKGVIQWAQHSYNPAKDDAGVPATWHWDNFFVTPRLPHGDDSSIPRQSHRRQRRSPEVDVRRTREGRCSASPSAACAGSTSTSATAGDERRSSPPAAATTSVESSASYLVKVPAGARRACVQVQRRRLVHRLSLLGRDTGPAPPPPLTVPGPRPIAEGRCSRRCRRSRCVASRTPTSRPSICGRETTGAVGSVIVDLPTGHVGGSGDEQNYRQ